MISKDQIQALATWARWVDAEAFCMIFGESLGMHIWNKMQQNHRGRFLEMWGFIDDECQAKFIEAINKGAN